MKIDLYIDIDPNSPFPPEWGLIATTQPFAKQEGSKRYKITCNIPDSAIYGEVDGAAPVEEVVEVDK